MSGTPSGCGCRAAGCETVPPQAEARPGDGLRLHIQDMDCPTEERMLRSKLESMPEVKALAFNLMERILTVQHAAGAEGHILEAVRELGFEPVVLSAGQDRPDEAPQSPDGRRTRYRLMVGGTLALLAELFSLMSGVPAWPGIVCALLAIGISGLGTYRKGWLALRHLDFNINALMSMAVTGAVLIGEWPEAAMVMVLFAVAEHIEARALDRSRNAIRSLMALAPDTARRRTASGDWDIVPAGQVVPGDVVQVRPGEKIPLDGEIIAGRATLNEAPVTGESLPVEKGVGDTVFSGTLNETGRLQIRVTRPAEDSTLARIIHAVEEAQAQKAPAQRFVDQFSRVYTPMVMSVAGLVAVLSPALAGVAWSEAIYRALVLLVIACPCALVISTPVTVVSALAAAARQGILIKGGKYLEMGRRLEVLAFDKTGTLTRGQPAVTDVRVLGDLPREDVIRVAVALARESDHPISRAMVESLASDSAGPDVEAFESLTGRGIAGRIGGVTYLLGNHRLLHERHLCSGALETRLDELERAGQTVLVLVADNAPVALFTLKDTLRPESREVLAELKRLGVKTLMLSGDNPHTVARVAAELGVDDARGHMLPEDKLGAIEALAEKAVTGMVGDGINDAPALARAQIGIAMGAAGTDTALETADVALMEDKLAKIPAFIRLSRAAHRILVQNIALALGIKVIFLVLALFGQATLWMAVFADMGASLLVIANGLRILRFRAA
ncbi:MAG: cadmium-translocating P-type ATPase [Gammaproteobacteria bacterium]|nr:MAG: cadmium-translocating P-type ATPase [Gammaproteobacteria bacterium]